MNKVKNAAFKFIALFTIIINVLTCSMTVAMAASNTISIYINGTKFKSPVEPDLIFDSDAYVPIRAICDKISGMATTWTKKTQTLTITTEWMYCIELQIGKSTAKTYFLDYSQYDFETQKGKISKDNVKYININESPYMKNNRMMISLSSMSQLTGYVFSIEAKNTRIDIYTDFSYVPVDNTVSMSDENEFKRYCKLNSIDYNDAVVNSKRNAGEHVSCTGTIKQLDGNIALIDVFWTDNDFAVQLPDEIIDNVYINDTCAVYGFLDGTKSYIYYDYYGVKRTVSYPVIDVIYADGHWNIDQFDENDYLRELCSMLGEWKQKYPISLTQPDYASVKITGSIRTFKYSEESEEYFIESVEKIRDLTQSEYLYIIINLPNFREYNPDGFPDYYDADEFPVKQVIKYYYLESRLEIYPLFIEALGYSSVVDDYSRAAIFTR